MIGIVIRSIILLQARLLSQTEHVLHDDQSQYLMILSERKAKHIESNSSQLLCWIF